MEKTVRLLVTYKFNNSDRDKFINEINKNNIPEMSRNEQGNIRYDYFLPLNNNNELLLIEEWQNKECVDKHKAAAHFILLQEIKAKYVTEVKFE